MKTIELFAKWGKSSTIMPSAQNIKRAIVYTRVSSKEQFDKNLSLDWQRKAIDEYAQRNGFEILDIFGGTYESAKTDGRKEFLRMIDFIKKRKGRVSHILVYLLDRFSRTGGGAIKLAEELRVKYGVTVLAVTQPIDTSNPGGVFQQDLQFLVSKYDNEIRKLRAVAGMREKFQRGIWCVKPPLGYDIVRTGGERKIVVNRQGKLLRRAFEWKARGMKNEEILQRLQGIGLKIYKQKLSMILSNPFYCGIISNKMLNGKLVEGKHEKLISPELFLQVNNVRKEAGGKYGVAHQKEVEAIPLKMFIKCPKCDLGYTGYIVKKKKLHYYKCRTTGCRCNKSAKRVNTQFLEFLSQYSIKAEYIQPLTDIMTARFEQMNASNFEHQRQLKLTLNQLQEKIDTIEEKYFVTGEMSRESYDRLSTKYAGEKEKLMLSLGNTAISSSNHEKYLKEVLSFSSKLATAWSSSPVNTKEKLQKLIFPDGIYYDMKNEVFRTNQANRVFALNAVLNSVSEDDINKQGGLNTTLSSCVGMTGFEPATPTSRT
jgi:site-specific DNA recombinase